MCKMTGGGGRMRRSEKIRMRDGDGGGQKARWGGGSRVLKCKICEVYSEEREKRQ